MTVAAARSYLHDHFGAAIDQANRLLSGAGSEAEREALKERIADAMEEAFVSFVSAQEGGFREFRDLPPVRPEAPPLPERL